MAAPGGYGAQVHMTHPVALLCSSRYVGRRDRPVLVAQKELGDHTRQTTHAVTSLVHHVRSGYDRAAAALTVRPLRTWPRAIQPRSTRRRELRGRITHRRAGFGRPSGGRPAAAKAQ